MTLAAASSKNTFQGDGSNTVFTFTFPIPSGSTGSDIAVYVVDDEGTPYLLASNYAVDVAESTITYPVTVDPVLGAGSPLPAGAAAVPEGWQLVAARIEPLSQLTTIANQGAFPAAAIEAALDKIVMVLQQMQEQVDRSYKAPVQEASSDADLADFLASVAAIYPPFSVGTYADLKILSTGAPTVRRFGFATDTRSLYFYTGTITDGDEGWVALS